MSGVRPKPTSSSQNQSRSNHGLGSVGGSSASEAYMWRLQQSAMSGTLQYMEPEELAPADEDLELELIDYEDSGSEFTSDDEDGAGNDAQSEYDTISNMNTGRTSEIFAIAEPLTDRSNKPDYIKMMEQEEEENMVSRQITFTGTLVSEGDIEMDSEEENDIMKEIKAEVLSHVRKDMGTELEVYKAKREMAGKEAEAQKHGDLAGLEPKIKEAILKMRKLDKILEKKIKREKEVKKDRILLQRRLKVELEEIKNDGHKESKEAQTNTSKFLALTLPPSHNKGVHVDDDHPSPPVTPVFQTQVLESNLKAGTANKGKHLSAAGSSAPESEAGRSSCSSSMSEFTDTTDITAGGTHKKAKRKKKDFIKRNKQLAADASNAIAMTDDEKNRVEGLLGDLETLPELPEEADAVEMAQENPYQITLSMGDGFLPTQEEMGRLNKIDDRLRALLPPEDFASVASVSRDITPQQ